MYDSDSHILHMTLDCSSLKYCVQPACLSLVHSPSDRPVCILPPHSSPDPLFTMSHKAQVSATPLEVSRTPTLNSGTHVPVREQNDGLEKAKEDHDLHGGEGESAFPEDKKVRTPVLACAVMYVCRT